MIHGQLHSFYAEDTVDVHDAEAGIDHLPVEYLQSLNPASLPPSHLQLRVGALVILLRNLDLKQELCNGTRMVVTRLGQRCIEVVSLTGQYTGIYTILIIIHQLILKKYRCTKAYISHPIIYDRGGITIYFDP